MILSKKISNYNFERIKKDLTLIKIKFKSLNNIKLNKNTRKFIFIIGMPRSGTSLTEQIFHLIKMYLVVVNYPIYKKYITIILNLNENLMKMIC